MTVVSHTILSNAMKGIKLDHHNSILEWSSIARHTFLKHVGNVSRLSTPLGHWISTPHQQWEWFRNKSQDKIYHNKASEWTRCEQIAVSQCSTRPSNLYGDPGGVASSRLVQGFPYHSHPLTRPKFYIQTQQQHLSLKLPIYAQIPLGPQEYLPSISWYTFVLPMLYWR